MNDLAEKIIENCDIVDIIGRYVNLKRAGSNYKGLCPFHNEKTPSFTVFPASQSYYCFGCGKGGNVIHFIRERDNLDFMEAVEKLASENGISIEINRGYPNEKKDDMYEITRKAAIHFYKNLREGSNAGLKYVISRGITPEVAKKFGIGYAKDGWDDLKAFFKENDISEEAGFESGLLSKNQNNVIFDKFRNRVIFPIKNTRDKVIGFGGRAIDGGSPKYLNSPETIIFKKKDNLYGLNLAKNSIRKQNLAILVEGYMDVVSLVAAGVENVVATLGTALTPEQAKLLKRYAATVVLSYDSDDAGQKATWRGIDLLLNAGLTVKILQIDKEKAKDPDEYIKKNGKLAFEELIKNASDFMDYKIERIKEKHNINTTEGSIGFLEEVSSELRWIKSEIRRGEYVKMASEKTGIPKSSIFREIKKITEDDTQLVNNSRQSAYEEKAMKKNRKRNYFKEIPSKKKETLVKEYIRLMIDSSKFIPVIAENSEIRNYFYGSGYERIFNNIVLNYSDDSEIDLEVLEDSLEEDDYIKLKDIENNVAPVIDEEKTLLECVSEMKIQYLEIERNEIIKIMGVLNEETDTDELAKLSNEIKEIGNKILELMEGKE